MTSAKSLWLLRDFVPEYHHARFSCDWTTNKGETKGGGGAQCAPPVYMVPKDPSLNRVKLWPPNVTSCFTFLPQFEKRLAKSMYKGGYYNHFFKQVVMKHERHGNFLLLKMAEIYREYNFRSEKPLFDDKK